MKWTLIACAAIVLAGCSSQDQNNISKDAQDFTQKAKESIGSMTLNSKVNTALDLRKDVNIKDLKIETKDGAVTLTGVVKSDDEKKRIHDVVSNTVGVDKVDDSRVKVAP